LPPCGGLGLSGGHGRRGARWNRALPARDRARSGWARWNWLAARVGGIVRILRRLSKPPGGRRWPPEGGPASLEAMGGGEHDRIGALPDGIGLYPLATVPARAGNGGTGSPPVRGHRQNFTKALRAAGRPPEGGPASLEAIGGGVHDGIGALPDGIGSPARDRARKGWARWNWLAARAGASLEFYKGSPSRREASGARPLRAAGRPPVASGGWPGLSGGHGRRGVRRNRGDARQNRALPARGRARKGWARWNWLVARMGASSEFLEGSPSRREAASTLRNDHRSASLESMGGGVHDGIGRCPTEFHFARSRPCPQGLGTVELARRPCGGIVRILRRLSEPVTSGQSPIPSGNAPIPSCTPPPLASREAEPPSGGHRRPPGDSESLRKILTMPPSGRRANSTVPSPCGHGRERAKPYSVGRRPYSVVHPAAHGLQRGRATLRRPPAASRRLGEAELRRPPGGSESLRKILTMPPHGRRANSTVPSPCGHGRERASQFRRATPPPVLGGAWAAGPTLARAGHGIGARWNRLAAFAGSSSEFYEGSPSRREAAGGLHRGGVHGPITKGIGSPPVGGTVEPWAAGCTTE